MREVRARSEVGSGRFACGVYIARVGKPPIRRHETLARAASYRAHTGICIASMLGIDADAASTYTPSNSSEGSSEKEKGTCHAKTIGPGRSDGAAFLRVGRQRQSAWAPSPSPVVGTMTTVHRPAVTLPLAYSQACRVPPPLCPPKRSIAMAPSSTEHLCFDQPVQGSRQRPDVGFPGL